MSDALSCAELATQHAELLPARTVLSMLDHGGIEITGPRGEQGVQGANGQSAGGFNFMQMLGWGAPETVPSSTAPTSGNPA